MRRYHLLACFSLLPFGVGQAQTSPGTVNQQPVCITCARPESNAAVEEDTTGAATASSSVIAPVPADLPDMPKPQPSTPVAPFAWKVDYPTNQVANAPRISPVWDKKMWAAHIVYLGAIVFDAETTHQGLAHHRCAEGDDALDSLPSRGSLYINNILFEFVPETALDTLIAYTGRIWHLPRGYWKPAGYLGATWGSIDHFRGGIQWYSRGCF